MGRLVVSVSQNAVVEAESAILGCDQCRPGAAAPFWRILDILRLTKDCKDTDIEVIYILPILASCPNCQAPIDEITLVEPKLPLDPHTGKSTLMRSKA